MKYELENERPQLSPGPSILKKHNDRPHNQSVVVQMCSVQSQKLGGIADTMRIIRSKIFSAISSFGMGFTLQLPLRNTRLLPGVSEKGFVRQDGPFPFSEGCRFEHPESVLLICYDFLCFAHCAEQGEDETVAYNQMCVCHLLVRASRHYSASQLCCGKVLTSSLRIKRSFCAYRRARVSAEPIDSSICRTGFWF